MARTEHLPTYKGTYDLCLYLEQVVHGFSRYHKYTLGTDMRDGARRALKLVVRANGLRERETELLALREQPEERKVLEAMATPHARGAAQGALPPSWRGQGAGSATWRYASRGNKRRGQCRRPTTGPLVR